MLELLHSFFASPGFIFFAGLLLLGSFFWYLAAESERTMRFVGTFFIIGLSAFSIVSLMDRGMQYGIDISGGVELTLEVQPKIDDQGQIVPPTADDMQMACTILDERLNSTGTSEVQIIHSKDKILIQIPQQDKDPEVNKQKLDAMVTMLTKMAKLELLAVHPRSSDIIYSAEMQENIAAYEVRKLEHEAKVAALGDDRSAASRLRAPALPRIPASLGASDYMVLEHPLTDNETNEPVLTKEGRQAIEYMVLQKPYAAMQQDVYITGKDVVDARPNGLSKGVVNVVLGRDGAGKMVRLTEPMSKGVDRLAVVLNGQVKSAPTVQSTLGKEFQISGLSAPGEAEDISKALANPLSSDLIVEGRKEVSAQLGKSALDQGIISGLVGFCAVMLFCFWYYRTAGIVAIVGLGINALILLGLMSLFGFVLTLPGIAGIVLTMGVAIDANVLIYERMREEQKLGRGFVEALRNAYEKAFSAIFDSNVTSLITAVILFALASGSIKGFAVTTSVGIVTSLLGAVVVTRVLFYWTDHFGIIKNMKFSHAPLEDKKFDFMGWRKPATIGSLILIIGCAVYGFGVRGEKALGIDFTGGAAITYVIPNDVPVDYDAVEKKVLGMKLSKSATPQEFSNVDDRNIKIRCANLQEAALIDEMLRADIPGMSDLQPASIDEVSASLGSTFFRTALVAIGVGLLGITIYLALRFEWSFAMGALVAIAHDLLVVIGLVVLMGTELSIIHIGAFLTVAGYSINDTIVIYDRIRERLRMAEPNESLVDVMNDAMNSTISRTILTSLSTLAVLASLIVLGGPSMRDFSITMLLGVLVGTYSSIYIASPMVLLFARKHDLKAEVLREEDELVTDGGAQ